MLAKYIAFIGWTT